MRNGQELSRNRFLRLSAMAAGGAAACGAGALGAASSARTGRKKLIEFGWDIPSARFVRDNVRKIEERPFEGVVFNVKEVRNDPEGYPNPDDIPNAFDTRRWSEKEMNLGTLRSIRWGRFTDNFLILWSTNYAGMDWFDDDLWDTIAANVRLYARAARVARARGIAFDPEAYGQNPWDYSSQPRAKTRTFREFQRKVRERGERFIRAIQSGHPGSRFLALGLLSWVKGILFVGNPGAEEIRRRLRRDGYGLWPSFVAGMLDAAPHGSQIIDGNEYAYYFVRDEWFDGARKDIKGKAFHPLLDPDVRDDYDRRVRAGNGVYVDGVLDLWDDPRFFGDCLASDEERISLLEHNAYHALRTADEYAWVYSENMNWWRGRMESDSTTVTFGDVEAAIRRARAKIRAGKPLGFSVDAAVDEALERCPGYGS